MVYNELSWHRWLTIPSSIVNYSYSSVEINLGSGKKVKNKNYLQNRFYFKKQKVKKTELV